MATQPRAPTSKLLELIRTGSPPQDKQDASDIREDASAEERTEAALVSAEPAEETEKRNNIAISSRFYKVPNVVDDHIVGGLSMAEEVVYRHMIRLSWGWNRNWCRVGTNYFLQKSSLKSRKAVRDAIARLLKRKLMMHHMVEGRIDRNQDGTVYIVPLPEEIGVLSDSTLNGSAPRDSVLPNSILGNNIPDKDLENRDSRHSILGNSMLQDSTPADSILSNGTVGVPSASVLRDSTLAQKPHGPPIQGGVLQNSILPDSRITDNSTDRSKDTLSPDQIIAFFYRGIGQSRVSKTKRERAEKSLKELTKDGFSLEDIHFAVEWTLKNSKEEPYDFSIITHTIGQAMAAKKKTEAEEARRIEAERIAAQERAEEELREREAAKIEAYKESLSAEERAKLREKAEAEIRDSGQFKEDFITNFLIEAKENEIIREQIGMKVSE